MDSLGHDASNETMYTFQAFNGTLAKGATTTIKVDGRVSALMVSAKGTALDLCGICVDMPPSSDSDYFQFPVNVVPFKFPCRIRKHIHLKNVSDNSLTYSICLIRN